jgi:hypothetical protein
MFTDPEVIAMRERYAAGATLDEAGEGKITRSALHHIVSGRNYADVGGPISIPWARNQAALVKKRGDLLRRLAAVDRLIVIGGAP